MATGLTGSLAEALALRDMRAGPAAGGRGRRGRPSGQPTPEEGEARRFLAKQSRMLDIQMEHLHEQRSLTLSHLRLRRWNEALKVTFQALTIFIGLAAVAIVGVIAWQAHNAEALIVEPLRTTPELAQRGLDGTVLASRLLDKLREIQNATNSARASSTFTKDFGDDIKLEIPQTGVSVGELQRYLRAWLGHDTHISGEVFRTGAAGLVAGAKPGMPGPDDLFLTVRAGAEPGDTFEGPVASLDAMIQSAAERVVAHTQPYRYTVFLMKHGRLEEADKALARLAVSGSADDRPWAYVNWGEISLLRGGDFAASDRKDRNALRLDPNLVLAHDNLANQEIALGHDESAVAQLAAEARVLASRPDKQLKKAVRPVLLAWTRTRLAGELGDWRGDAQGARAAQALEDYQGISSAALLNEAAALALEHDVAASRRLLATAGRPAGASSFTESFGWGSSLLPEIAQDLAVEDWPGLRRDLQTAEGSATDPIWRRGAVRTYLWPWLAWADAMIGDRATAEKLIAATPPDCYLCLRLRGRLAALGGDRSGAVAWFAQATRLGPSLPFAWLDWGQMLAARGDLKGAIGMYRRAHDRSPTFADPLEAWGEALLAKGDAEGAIARFAAAERTAPRWGRLQLMWGEALTALRRPDEALKHYRAAAGMDLTAPEAALLARRRPARNPPPRGA